MSRKVSAVPAGERKVVCGSQSKLTGPFSVSRAMKKARFVGELQGLETVGPRGRTPPLEATAPARPLGATELCAPGGSFSHPHIPGLRAPHPALLSCRETRAPRREGPWPRGRKRQRASGAP